MSDDQRYGQQQGGEPGARSPEYRDDLTREQRDKAYSDEGGMTGTGGLTGTGTSVGTGDLGSNDGRVNEVTSDETGTLIAADKVQGTAVYDASGERLGTIDSLMLNKRSGKVAYAVMSFGGFLGIGERYHPLPWDVLTYDVDKGGYNIGHTGEQLRTAPNYSRDEIDADDFGSRGREVDDYYGRSATLGGTMPPTGVV